MKRRHPYHEVSSATVEFSTIVAILTGAACCVEKPHRPSRSSLVLAVWTAVVARFEVDDHDRGSRHVTTGGLDHHQLFTSTLLAASLTVTVDHDADHPRRELIETREIGRSARIGRSPGNARHARRACGLIVGVIQATSEMRCRSGSSSPPHVQAGVDLWWSTR